MKLKGFTLAEVLVTIGLIGVVASLTLPAISTNIQKQQMGPALLRAAATLETANSLMMVEQDILSFKASCGTNYISQCFIPYIAPKIGAHFVPHAQIKPYKFMNSDTSINMHESKYDAYMSKNGFIYYLYNEDLANNADNYGMFVDVNGNKGPNTVGKDTFYLGMYFSDGGKLDFTGSDTAKYDNGFWHTRCNSRSVDNLGMDCAGSILDNNGKVIYPW